MKKWSFEELEVRQLARLLSKDLGCIFYHEKFRNYSFQDQIMRAALSVLNNIAEWNESQSSKEFIKFLYYAKRSAWEVRSMLYSALDFSYLDAQQFENFQRQYQTLSVKLYNFISYLRNKQ